MKRYPFPFCVALCLSLHSACAPSSTASDVDAAAADVDAAVADGAPVADAFSAADAAVLQYAELWYSVEDSLFRFALSPDSGIATGLSQSTTSVALPLGHNSLTMLSDGSLLGARLSEEDLQTHFYYIQSPPRDGGLASVQALGVMPNQIKLEALYTDCDGRVYGMDTGSDVTNADGNRLLRFKGNLLAGDFAYDIVSDLSIADVADIDDMSPAIEANEIIDNPGLAIDSGVVHTFNYETGTGAQVGSGGGLGIHALGSSLFNDDTARLYVLSNEAELYQMDPETFEVGPLLLQGPLVSQGIRGWSGLAGPLTECDTGFIID